MVNLFNCAGVAIWDCKIPSEKTCYFYPETGLYYISYVSGATYSPPIGTGKKTFSSGMMLCELINKLIYDNDKKKLKEEQKKKESERYTACNNQQLIAFKHREYHECGEPFDKNETCIIDNLIYVSKKYKNKTNPKRGVASGEWAGGFDNSQYIKYIVENTK